VYVEGPVQEVFQPHLTVRTKLITQLLTVATLFIQLLVSIQII